MIPFFEPPSFALGPLTIHGFGVAVAVAIVLGTTIYQRRVQKLGLDVQLASDLLYAILGGGFIGAHLVDVLVYRPHALKDDPLLLFKLWNGISSFGGFFGGTIATLLFLRWKKVPRAHLWGYCESIIIGFPFAWIFGRLGCSMAHDHPGAPSTSFLAVGAPTERFLMANPDMLVQVGAQRVPFGSLGAMATGAPYEALPFFDLGFLEMLYTIGMCAVLFALLRKERPLGFYLAVVPVLYAPVRFGLDYLRIRDVRYLGFTPGQYAAAALILLAALVVWRRPKGVFRFDGEGRPVGADGAPVAVEG